MSLAERARIHAALGDEHRLAIVDHLWASDLTPGELGELTGLASNLLAFHLDVLEDAALVERTRSEGDGRRRYLRLRADRLPDRGRPVPPTGLVLFVCTHNSARSQLAAAIWAQRHGGRAASAGSHPAGRVHPLAVAVAEAHGLDLSDARPRAYDEVADHPEVVVSVCDRARESVLPFRAPLVHWSVPDPVGGRRRDFTRAYEQLADRADRLAGVAVA